jgi:hypothetical protein
MSPTVLVWIREFGAVCGRANRRQVDQHCACCFDGIAHSFDFTGAEIVQDSDAACTPEQALDCFLRTKMDVLVLENTVIARRKSVRDVG